MHIATQSSQHHLLKRLYLHYFGPRSFVVNWLSIYFRAYYEFAILIHWSDNLSLSYYHAILITTACSIVKYQETQNLPILYVALAYQDV